MHFFPANRCGLILLFALAVVSSMANKICQKLHNQQEKIRVLGEADGGTLIIITTSGHMFKLNLKSTLLKHNSKGHYYLNISQEPTSHVDKEWPNVHLDLSENKNKLYALQFGHGYTRAILTCMFKTKTGDWQDSLYSHGCRLELEIGLSPTDWTVNKFVRCYFKTVNDNRYAFMVSHSSVFSPNVKTFVKFRIASANRYYCDDANVNCFNIDNFLSDGTVLAASHLAEPYNILLFIYTSGVVEIRQVPTSPTFEAPSPNWTVRIGDFIQCEATQEATSTSTQQEQPGSGPESTTTEDVPGLWHTHTWRIVIVAVLLVLNGICLVLLYRKRYKKEEGMTEWEKCSEVNKKSPNQSSIQPIDSSVDNSITGTRRRVESSQTGLLISRKNKKKVSECPSSIPKSSTPKGSTIKPIGSTLTIRAESGSPLANERNSKPSSKIESTPSSATVSNPSNVNSKASVKLSLEKKKQTTGKWIAKWKRKEKRQE